MTQPGKARPARPKIFATLAMLVLLVLQLAAGMAHADPEEIEIIQRRLALLEFQPGPADGLWGRRTEGAANAFLATQEMPGTASRDALDDLREALDLAWVEALTRADPDQPHLRTPVDLSDARHLLERTGIGADAGSVAAILGLTRAEAIAHVLRGYLSRDTIDLPPFATAPVPPYWLRSDLSDPDRDAFNTARGQELSELRAWWLRQMIETPTPQVERMALFWHNHFVSSYAGVDEMTHAMLSQHQTFRRLGLVNFRMLAQAMLRDPALLMYLDNDDSRREHPNENLAREMMELFVLGEGNYDETAVRELARAFTGNGVNRMGDLTFAFHPWDHDTGTISLFGRRGRLSPEAALDLVLEQPGATRFVTRKLWRHMVSEFNEDDAEIERLSQILRDSDFDLLALLHGILASDAFWAADNRGTVVKSPIDLLVGTIRTTGHVPSDWQSLPLYLSNLGQDLFAPPNVAGWPGGASWVSPGLLLRRQDMMAAFDATTSTDAPPSHGMAGMMAEGNGMMSGDMDARDAFIVRYAAENFEGAPIFQLRLLDANRRTIWRSDRTTALGGLDTLRFGRAENASDLVWQEARFHPGDVPQWDHVQVTFMNDHCCGPGGADGGDRNLFVDWVRVGDEVYPAALGEQVSNCSNTNSPGSLYCAGSVTISESVPFEPQVPSEATPNVGNRLLVERSVYQWSSPMRPNGDWNSLQIGLLNVSFRQFHFRALGLQIVRRQSGEIHLTLRSEDCAPDCFETWPTIADRSETGERSMHFTLQDGFGRHAGHYRALSEDERALVSALWMSVPRLLEAAQQGRNWQDRNAVAQLAGWEPTLDLIRTTLPRSRHATGWSDEMLVLLPQVPVMSMMMAQTTPGQPVVGGIAESTGWMGQLQEAGAETLLPLFLAVQPSAGSPRDVTLADLLRDPAYNLR